MKMSDIKNKETGNVFNAISSGLRNEGDRLIVPNFGTFTVKKSIARKGRNPATGAVVDIPAKLSIKFKMSDTYKQEIN